MRNSIPRRQIFLAIVAISNLFCSPAAAQLNENFDSYEDGQNLQGINGWKGFLNCPDVCGSATSVQSNSAPLSLAIQEDEDTVNEMGNPQSGKWSLTFDQFIPSTSTGQQYLLMHSVYNDNGVLRYSVQTRFDSDCGMLIDEFDSTFPGMPLVTDMWVPMRLIIDLDNDQVEQYYNDVFINSLPWSTRAFDNTGKGETAIGSIDLFSLFSASVLYYDNIVLKEIVEIAPDDYTAIRGFLVSGSLQDVSASDDCHLKYQPGITLSADESPVWLEFEYTISTDSTGSLRAMVETSANTLGIVQQVEFYNWNSAQFEQIASADVSLFEDSIDYIDLSIQDYVHPETGQVRTRLLFKQQGIAILFPWTVSIDAFVLRVDAS